MAVPHLGAAPACGGSIAELPRSVRATYGRRGSQVELAVKACTTLAVLVTSIVRRRRRQRSEAGPGGGQWCGGRPAVCARD